MARVRKTLGWTAGIVLGIVLLVLVLLLLLGRTEFGTRQVGERAVAFLDDKIVGDLRVGSVSGGGIFRGVTLHDVVLEDSLGRPFLRADSARLAYHLRTLVRGDIVLSSVELWSPYAVIERAPGDSTWNYERVFASTVPDTTTSPSTGSNLVLLESAEVHNGTVLVRMPWEPDPTEPVEPADTARMMLDATPAGLVREMRFEAIDAELERLLVESPGEEGRLFEIDRLSARAFVWDTPAELEQLSGTITQRDSLIAFELDELRLPNTRASGVGRVFTEPDLRFDLDLDVEQLSLGDLQWLRPELPAEATGSGRIRLLQREDGSTLFRARELDLEGPGTRVTGSVGLVMGDSLYFTGVDLNADPLNLDFIDRLIPGGLPIEGVMIGNMRIEGPISSLRTSGDARLSHESGDGWTTARWSGEMDLRPPYHVRDLEVEFETLDPALLARIAPEQLQLEEAADGRLLANGSPGGRLDIQAEVRLPEAHGGGVVAGTVVVEPEAGGHRVDAQVEADDYALRRLEKFVPELRLLGDAASGPVHVLSSRDTIHVYADVRAADGGLHVEGAFPRGDSLGFALRIELDDIALDRVIEVLPPSRVTGLVTLEARPGEPGKLLHADVDSGSFMDVPLTGGRFAGRIQDDGVLRVDTLRLRSAAGRIAATGLLGISDGTSGALRVVAQADSARWLAPMLGMAADSAVLRGRSRFDGSIVGTYRDFRLSGAGEFEQAFFRGLGAPAGEYTLTFDWTAGRSPIVDLRMAAERTLLGTRRLGSIDLVATRDTAGKGIVELQVVTPFAQAYAAAAEYQDSGDTTIVHMQKASIVEGSEVWRLDAPATIRLDGSGAHVQPLALVREGGGRVQVAGVVPWRAPWLDTPDSADVMRTPAVPSDGIVGTARRLLTALAGGARVPSAKGGAEPVRRSGGRNAEAVSALARNSGNDGPAYDAPSRMAVDFTISASGAPLSAFAHVIDPESTLDGVLFGTMRLLGPAAAPVIESDGMVRSFRYEDVELERVTGRLGYRNQLVQVAVDAFRDGRSVLHARLALPGEVRMAPLDLQRLPLPIAGRVIAESMPAALPAGLFDGIREVRGEVSGEVDLSGTPFDLVLRGQMELKDAAFTLTTANVRYSGVNGLVRVLGDQELDVEVRGRTESGSAQLTGRILLAHPDNPEFALRLDASHLQLTRRRDLEAAASGWVELTGSYRAPRVSGRMTVDEGSLNLDELVREALVVGLENPLLMEAVDTSQVSVRRILRDNQNPFLAGLVLSLDADVRGNFWVRSEVLNLEVAGDVTLDYATEAQDITMAGSLQAMRGFYNFQVAGFPLRRFQVRDGLIEFVGVPGLNPNLSITAAYRARTTNGDPLDIRAIVDGTMRSPQVRLTSDSDPPIAESDLASYLIFGRPTYALSQGEARALDNQWAAATVSTVANIGIPLALSYASSEVEAVASQFGIDYVSISNEELAEHALNYGWQPDQLLVGTRFEFGRYFGDEWFVAFTPKVSQDRESSTLAPGGRVEWRFHPTWNAELFFEDRLVQAGNAGFDRNLASPSVLGLFLFREWGY